MSDLGDLSDAYPWPSSTWTRVAMLRALDGGVAGPDGRSRSISSGADRKVLSEIRRLSDAIVVGAGTVRAEPYGPLGPDDGDRATAQQRRSAGQARCPVLVVVTGSLDLPWAEPMFRQSVVRPIVVTADGSQGGHEERDLARAREHADVHLVPGSRADVRDVVRLLHARGLTRLVCEGGPALLGQFAAADLVDEVDLTLSPVMPTFGPPAMAPPFDAAADAPVAQPSRFELVSTFEADSYLFARYLRPGRGHAGRRPGAPE